MLNKLEVNLEHTRKNRAKISPSLRYMRQQLPASRLSLAKEASQGE